MVIGPDTRHKAALGIHWDTKQDILHISTLQLDHSIQFTKQMLTSDVAKVFMSGLVYTCCHKCKT